MHALVGLRARVDLAGGGGDLAVEVADQRHQAVQPPARALGQLQAGEELASGLAEQVGVLGQDALAGQQRVHAVLDRGAHPGQHGAVAQQLAQVAQLGRGDVRLGQQPGAQQVRERLGVDRVGLHPRGGDRLRPQRVGEVHVVAGLLEQVGQPLPAVGRLERHVRPVRVAEQLPERVAVVDDPARERKLSVLVDDRDLRAPTVQVDADPARRVTHGRYLRLELSGRAAIIRTVSKLAVRGGGPTSCRPDGARRPGPPEPARPFMTSTPGVR